MKGQQLLYKDGAYSLCGYCVWCKLLENIPGYLLKKKFISENMYSHNKHKNLPSVRLLCEFIGSTTVTMICFCVVNIHLQLNNHPKNYSILHKTVTINNISCFTSVNIPKYVWKVAVHLGYGRVHLNCDYE